MVVLYHTAIGLCNRHVTVEHYRLLTVYGEIIVGPRFLAGGCRACEVPLPKTEVQRWFHHTRSVTVLLHTLILLLLNLCILNISRVKIHDHYDHSLIFVKTEPVSKIKCNSSQTVLSKNLKSCSHYKFGLNSYSWLILYSSLCLYLTICNILHTCLL